MTKQPTKLPKKKINESLTLWDREQDLTQFIRQRLSLTDKTTSKLHIEDIVDNAIMRAKIEEDPKWTPLVLNAIQPKEDKNSGTQVNIFQSLIEPTSERIKELVDVTPKKKSSNKTIEEII